MLSLVTIVGLVVPSFYLFYLFIVYPILISPLSKIPNAHFTVPLIPWIWFKRRRGRTGIAAIYSAHKKHGPIVRISPNELSVSTLDGIRRIYSNAFEKTDFYLEFVNFKTPNLVSMIENRPHSEQKRMISHVYSKSYVSNSPDLQALSSVILFNRLVPILKAAGDGNVGVYPLNQSIGTDFSTAYLFGITNSTNLIQDPVARELWHSNIKIKMKFLPEKDKASEEVERDTLKMCQAAENFLHSEKLGNSLPTSYPVVYSQISSHLIQSPSPFNESNRIAAASEMLDHIIAAQETARITFTYLQWELSLLLRAELLTLSPQLIPNSSPDNPHSLPSPQALDSLPLLDAILKEALRIYTPSPALLPRITPHEGATIDGYFIPGGTLIGTSAYILHRNPSIFPDPEAFKPERWLKDPEEVREMMRWYWPFASGPRMCIGSHFAIHLIKVVIATMYSNFETSVVEDEGIEQEDAFLAGPVGRSLF